MKNYLSTSAPSGVWPLHLWWWGQGVGRVGGGGSVHVDVLEVERAFVNLLTGGEVISFLLALYHL